MYIERVRGSKKETETSNRFPNYSSSSDGSKYKKVKEDLGSLIIAELIINSGPVFALI